MEAIDSLLFAIFALYSWASLHFTDVLYIILQTPLSYPSATPYIVILIIPFARSVKFEGSLRLYGAIFEKTDLIPGYQLLVNLVSILPLCVYFNLSISLPPRAMNKCHSYFGLYYRFRPYK